MSEFATQLGSRDADQVIAAAKECAAQYPETLRTEIEIAFIKGALFSQKINTDSHKEIIDDIFRRMR